MFCCFLKKNLRLNLHQFYTKWVELNMEYHGKPPNRMRFSFIYKKQKQEEHILLLLSITLWIFEIFGQLANPRGANAAL